MVWCTSSSVRERKELLSPDSPGIWALQTRPLRAEATGAKSARSWFRPSPADTPADASRPRAGTSTASTPQRRVHAEHPAGTHTTAYSARAHSGNGRAANQRVRRVCPELMGAERRNHLSTALGLHFARLTLSWKIILSTMFTSTFLLFGLQNHPRFKEKKVSQKPRQISSIIEEYGTRLYHYQVRLRLPKEQLELLKKESQTLENNFREILLLTEQIDVLKALLRDMKDGIHNHSWPAHQEAVQNQGTTEVLDDEVSNLVHYVLKKFRGDQIQMADYALKSAGASVIEAGTSESYKNNKAKLYWHGIGFLNYEMPPDMILQPDVHPGKCWAFPGSQGHILIKLARKIIPTAVTMEHISEKVSPSGNTSSAPKEFSVYGMMKRCEGEEMFLGQFMYNKVETTVQTFELQNEVSESLLCVKLQILSNWGHPKYTCLYRFRVHGIPSDHT
ncbi:SUN domain-containing protein 3 [Chionomys nivalis]|uniref:SUN domain-containing protein 3 n=1 Tax=Chionomys nivalis TaxID=269649 RepID=UPI0025979E6A|nr:SUN domain-containing protein 3 [Chionomys nivalis]